MRFSGGMEQERSLYAAEDHRHHKQLRDEIDKSPKKDEELRPVVEIRVAGIPGGARARALHSLSSEAAPGAWLSKVAD